MPVAFHLCYHCLWKILLLMLPLRISGSCFRRCSISQTNVSETACHEQSSISRCLGELYPVICIHRYKFQTIGRSVCERHSLLVGILQICLAFPQSPNKEAWVPEATKYNMIQLKCICKFIRTAFVGPGC